MQNNSWPISNHFSKMANQNFGMVHLLCTHGQSNSWRIGKMADHFKFLILHSALVSHKGWHEEWRLLEWEGQSTSWGLQWSAERYWYPRQIDMHLWSKQEVPNRALILCTICRNAWCRLCLIWSKSATVIIVGNIEIEVWFCLIIWTESEHHAFHSSLYDSCLWGMCKVLATTLLISDLIWPCGYLGRPCLHPPARTQALLKDCLHNVGGKLAVHSN